MAREETAMASVELAHHSQPNSRPSTGHQHGQKRSVAAPDETRYVAVVKLRTSC